MDTLAPDRVEKTERKSDITSDIKSHLQLPDTRYKVPLAELVSTIVASNEPQYQTLQGAIAQKQNIREDIFDALNVNDWEKALYDEANFQFSSKHRPLVEAILNGVDSELRKEVRTYVKDPHKAVHVQINGHGFRVQDNGEGMDLDTALTKLLIPKLSGNMVDKSEVIGRFGVGFYSLLGYLKNPHDKVIVRTTNGTEGWRISLGRNSDSETESERFSVVISPLSQHDSERLQQGTELEVHSKDFDKQAAIDYVSETLQFKPDAQIIVNDDLINKQEGMQEFGYNLPQHREGKQSAVRVLASDELTSDATVTLAVGGVKVESQVVRGYQLPKHVVLDLPAQTALPKSRDKVEVTQDTVQVVSRAIEGVLSEDYHDAAKIWTTLAPVITKLQERNPSAKRTQNMDLKLRELVKQWADSLPSGSMFVPNSPELEKVALEDPIVIDEKYLPIKPEFLHLAKAPEFSSSTTKFYWAPFTTDNIIAVLPGVVFGNEAVKTSEPAVLGMMNALLQVHNRAVGEDGIQVMGTFHMPAEVVAHPTTIAKPAFDTPGSVSIGTMEDGQEDFEYRVPEALQNYLSELYPDQYIGAVWNEEAQTYIHPVDAYTPENVEEFRTRWLKSIVYDLVSSHCYPENGQDIYISDNTDFWKTIITPDFYQSFLQLANMDRAEQIEILRNNIPSVLRDELPKEENKTHAFLSQLRTRCESIEENTRFTDEEKRQIVRSYFLYEAATHLGPQKSLYDDAITLESLTRTGKFTNLANELFNGTINPASVGMHGFAVGAEHYGGERSVLESELVLLQYLKTPEERIAYLDWFDRHKESLKDLLSQHQSHKLGLQLYDNTGKTFHIPSVFPYVDIYLASFDTPNWDILTHNQQVMRSFVEDPQLQEVFFHPQKWQIDPYGPPLEFFLTGRIDRENIDTIVKTWDEADGDLHWGYAQEALAYSHLPKETFEQVNVFLQRLYTERDPAIEEQLRELGGNYEFVFSMSRRFNWLSQNDDYFDSSYTENGIFKRAHLDTPEQLEKRIAFLSEYPAEYARAYNFLLSELFTPLDAHPVVGFQKEYEATEAKLRIMFNKLFDMPQQDAIKILALVVGELKEKKDVRERLDTYESISREARPWLTYLLKNTELPRKETGAFMEGLKTIRVQGSDIVGSYFTSDALAHTQKTEELGDVFSITADRKWAKQLGQRRIEHAVNYQSTQGYMWLRELVQNAYNATRESDQKQVKIGNYVSENGFVISVEDPGGMELQTVVNALLIPQKSQWYSQEALGYFGQGFYTVFKEADAVRIKTGTGKGKTTYVEITPIKDTKGEKVVDLQICIGEKEEEYKGTAITWEKETDIPDFEALRAKAELETYAGLIPQEGLEVRWNEELINRNMQHIGQVDTNLGALRMYQVQGENTVTHNGLYVNELGEELTASMPETIKKILIKQGVVIDLPPAVKLIDSRADIADKETVLPTIQGAITQVSIQAATQLFSQGYVTFDALPEDFFRRVGVYANRIDQRIKDDAIAISKGEKSINWSRYEKSDANAVQLLLLIPSVEIDGDIVSLFDAIQKAQANTDVLKQLPSKLQDILRERPTEMQEYHSQKPVFEKAGYMEIGDFSVNGLPAEFDTYEAFQWVSMELLQPAVDQERKSYVPTFYCRPDDTIAHCMPSLGIIGWNLYGVDAKIQTLSKIITGEHVSAQTHQKFYEQLSEVGAHEYQHRVENSVESLTHNKEFFKGQERILESMIKGSSIRKTESELRSAYQGNYQSAAQLSTFQATRHSLDDMAHSA